MTTQISKGANQKTIIALILIIIGIAGLMWWGKLAQKSKINPEELATNSRLGKIENTLSVEEMFYDFGAISMKNGNVSKVFKISNPGNRDINLKSISTSCMCTVAYVVRHDGSKKGPFGMPGHGGVVPRANEIIKTGETRDIEVVYDPNAHGPAGVGKIDRFIYLEDVNGNKLQLEIKANVTP